MKNSWVGACIVLAACSGEYEGEEYLEEEELGTLEEGLSAPASPSFQLGTRNASNQARCNTTSTGQVCQVPSTKNQIQCGYFHTVIPGMFGTASAEVISAFDALSGWSFPVADQLFFSCNAAQVDKRIEWSTQPSGCGTSGSASNDINNYVCVTFGPGTGLTEGAGVVGNYTKHSYCRIRVDIDEIRAKGTTDTADVNMFKHALGHGFAKCLGLGNRSTVSSTWTRAQMSSGAIGPLTAGEQCVLNNFSDGSPTTFSLAPVPCTSD